MKMHPNNNAQQVSNKHVTKIAWKWQFCMQALKSL